MQMPKEWTEKVKEGVSRWQQSRPKHERSRSASIAALAQARQDETRERPMLLPEDWRHCPDFPNYEVSRYGHIKRIDTDYCIKQTLRPDGALMCIVTTCSGKRKGIRPHIQIAKAFLGEPNAKAFVVHKDGNKQNNRAENLYWKDKPKAKPKPPSKAKPIKLGPPKPTMKQRAAMQLKIEGEEWRPCHIEKFEASNMGRVRNSRTGYVLKQNYTHGGYLAVSNRVGTKQKKAKVHRLVAIAFHGQPPKGEQMTVDHIDGDNQNNRASNLEWVELKENLRRRHARQRLKRSGTPTKK